MKANLFMIAFLLIATTTIAAPTTKPTTNPIYLQGWIDAGGQVEAPTPPTLPDLDKLFVTPGPPVKIPKGTYTLKVTAKPVRSVDCSGSTIVAPATGPCFELTHNEVEIKDLICDKANIFCHVLADDCRLEDATVNNCINVIKVELSAQRFVAENVKGTANSVGFYAESPCRLLNCSIHSNWEYCVRFSYAGTGPVLSGYAIVGGEYTNAGNQAGKDTMGFRGGSGTMEGTIIHGNVRQAQSNQPDTTKPGDWSTFTVHNCIFKDQSPGHNYIEVKQGGLLYEYDNTFIPAKNPNIAVEVHGGAVVHGPRSTTQPTTLP